MEVVTNVRESEVEVLQAAVAAAGLLKPKPVVGTLIVKLAFEISKINIANGFNFNSSSCCLNIGNIQYSGTIISNAVSLERLGKLTLRLLIMIF